MLATGVTSAKRNLSTTLPTDIEDRVRVQIERLEQQLLETQKRGDLTEEARLCNNIAKKWERLGEYRKALTFHHYDRQISETLQDGEGLGLALGNMAQSCRMMGLKVLADQYLKDQLRSAQQFQDMPQVFNALISMGNAFLSESEDLVPIIRDERLAEAGVFFYRAHEALDSYEAVIEAGLLAKSRRKELSRLRLVGLLNEGKLCLGREQFDAALAKLRLAFDGAHDIGEKMLEFEILGLMGIAFSKMKEVQLAVEGCYDLQLSIAKETKDSELEQEALFNLAMAYRSLREFDLALRTFYLYKELLKSDCLDNDRLEEADGAIAETIELEELAGKTKVLEGRLESMSHPERSYLKLAKYLKRLCMMQDALTYIRSYCEAIPDVPEGFRVACELCIYFKMGEDAVYYAKKYLAMVDTLSEVEYEEKIDGILLLAKAFWLLPTLPVEILQTLQNALEWTQQQKDSFRELEVLDHLARAYQSFGMDEQYLQYKDKCLTIWNEQRAEEDTTIVETIVRELDELDYFVNRKASKSVMKLVDGQFNMTSRTRGTKGLEIKKRSRKKDEPKKSIRRRNVVQVNDGDLADFIVDDQASDDSIVKSSVKFKKKIPKLPVEMSDYDEMPTRGLVWPPSPKPSEMGSDRGSTSLLSSSRRTWSGDPACIATVLRVTVEIEGENLVIPVIDDIAERKTVGWLIREASDRYREGFGKEPIIETLLTADGRLSALDPVGLLLTDGQRVKALVSGFKFKSLMSLYKEACLECEVEADQRVELMLEGCTDNLDLSMWEYDRGHFDLVIRAICKHSDVNNVPLKFDLSSNYFVDDSILQRLPKSIVSLSISFTSVTMISRVLSLFPQLERFSFSFCKVEDLADFIGATGLSTLPLRDLEMAGMDLRGIHLGDWHHLSIESLNLSFCMIDETVIFGLAEIIRKSATIRKIDLTGCKAGHGIKPILEALRENYSLMEIGLVGNNLSTEQIGMLDKIITENPRSRLQRVVISKDTLSQVVQVGCK
jgi:tetratricopeptide (TPR) repeat protein